MARRMLEPAERITYRPRSRGDLAMTYVPPNKEGSIVAYRSRYENFIGGDWVRPTKERYFENVTPVTGRTFCEVPQSTAEDIEKALDAAHGAKAAWGRTSAGDR